MQSITFVLQNRRQKVVNRGFYDLCGGASHSNLTKIPLIYSVPYFNLGGAKPTKAPPWRRDCCAVIVRCLRRTPQCLKGIIAYYFKEKIKTLV